MPGEILSTAGVMEVVLSQTDHRCTFLIAAVGGSRDSQSSVKAGTGVGGEKQTAPEGLKQTSHLRPQIRREYPLNLSISLSGGKETNQDSPSNGE